MQAVIIDYGSGNLRSAAKAFERAAREGGAAMAVKVSADPRDVAASSHIVLPGVGAFADCMNGLRGLPGMIDALTRAVREDRRPFLGICVGMQLLATKGHEHGTHAGLGWLDGEVHRLAAGGQGFKVPHMGWNELTPQATAHPLLSGIGKGAHAYFVHSYHLVPRDPADTLATTDYGGAMLAVAGRDNIAGTQFHPEKSQEAGLRLIANFLRWRP
jgi:glutamine amidotransferase